MTQTFDFSTGTGGADLSTLGFTRLIGPNNGIILDPTTKFPKGASAGGSPGDLGNFFVYTTPVGLETTETITTRIANNIFYSGAGIGFRLHLGSTGRLCGYIFLPPGNDGAATINIERLTDGIVDSYPGGWVVDPTKDVTYTVTNVNGIPTFYATQNGVPLPRAGGGPQPNDTASGAYTTPSTYGIFTAANGGNPILSSNFVTGFTNVNNPTPIAISGTPGDGQVGVAYSFTPTTQYGSGTKTFAITSGTLPAGLSISSTTGAITGTPTTAQTKTGITLTVTDTTGSASISNFTINIAPVQPIGISILPPAATTGQPYSVGGTLTGGSGTKTYALTGSLPGTLSFSTTTGLITGTPVAAGNITGLVITVTDSTGTASTPPFAISVLSSSVTYVPYLPTSWQFGVYNVGQESLAQCLQDGFDYIVYDRYDNNGRSPAYGLSWDAARKSANVYAWLIPGLFSNDTNVNGYYTYDLTSQLDKALADPTIIGFATIDEAGTQDRGGGFYANGAQILIQRQSAPEAIQFMNYCDARADQLGLPRKPMLDNTTELLYGNYGLRQYLDIARTDFHASDDYFADYGQTRLMGTVGGGLASIGDVFMSTREGFSAYNATQVVNYVSPGPDGTGTISAPVASRGKPYAPYVQPGQIDYASTYPNKGTPTIGEIDSQVWSSFHNGATGTLSFVTLFGAPGGIVPYNFGSQFKPWIASVKQRMGVLQSRGCLFKSTGGLTPFTFRHSAPASGSQPFVYDTTAAGTTFPAPTGTQLPGGFEGSLRTSIPSGKNTYVITNLMNETRVLTDSTWGITNLSFNALETKAFDVSDTGFTNNLFGTISKYWTAGHDLCLFTGLSNGSSIVVSSLGIADSPNGVVTIDDHARVNSNNTGLVKGALVPNVGQYIICTVTESNANAVNSPHPNKIVISVQA